MNIYLKKRETTSNKGRRMCQPNKDKITNLSFPQDSMLGKLSWMQAQNKEKQNKILLSID